MLLLILLPSLDVLSSFAFTAEFSPIFTISRVISVLTLSLAISVKSEFCSIDSLIKDLHYGKYFGVDEGDVYKRQP